MGLKMGFSSSSYDCSCTCGQTNNTIATGNPDPSNFEIKQVFAKGEYILCSIHYPDCRNYEGNKILLFKDLKVASLYNFNTIDPHFSNNKKFKSPIARFEPTAFGWECGVGLIHTLLGDERRFGI